MKNSLRTASDNETQLQNWSLPFFADGTSFSVLHRAWGYRPDAYFRSAEAIPTSKQQTVIIWKTWCYAKQEKHRPSWSSAIRFVPDLLRAGMATTGILTATYVTAQVPGCIIGLYRIWFFFKSGRGWIWPDLELQMQLGLDSVLSGIWRWPVISSKTHERVHN